MHFDPDRHHRRSIRLCGHDYSRGGVYFVTFCTRQRECILGEVVGGRMVASDLGRAVIDVWNTLADCYPTLGLDALQVMPNHVHANLVVEVGPAPPSTRRQMLLPRVVGRWKAQSAIAINRLRGTPGVPVWQRNYYERLIRSGDELARSRAYIRDNPQHWDDDPDHPCRHRHGT